ncbi:MAG: Mrp/NBP35 family ATP-binding protein [Planctomycetaceae bacterium]
MAIPFNLENARNVLTDILKPDQVVEAKVADGRVTITVAAEVATAEKMRFAEEVKRRVKTLKGVAEVLVSYVKPASSEAPEPVNPLRGVKHVVAVGAGKGGVGKSTVAVNLAVALGKLGYRTGLLDADVYGPSAAIMTGTQEHKAQADAQRRVLPAERHGIRIISIAFLMPPDQASGVIWRGPMVGKMVEQLLTGVAWGELDYMIVDLPPGTGDAAISLAQKVPLSGAVVVTTPQDVALLDVLKAMSMFQQLKVPLLGVVENMAGFTCRHCGKNTPIFLEGAGRRGADRFGVPLLGSLPLDEAIPPGGDGGRPVVAEAPESIPGKAFAALAKAIVARVEALAGEARPGEVDLAWK